MLGQKGSISWKEPKDWMTLCQIQLEMIAVGSRSLFFQNTAPEKMRHNRIMIVLISALKEMGIENEVGSHIKIIRERFRGCSC